MKKKILINFYWLALVISIFSCFGKKEPKLNLETWLDKNFPGQYEVLSNRRDLQPRYFIQHKMTSVIADKKDPEVQCVFDWYKDTADIGITTTEIENGFEQSRKETELSRQLFSELVKNGSTNTSVAVVEDAAYFLIYKEPIIENRNTHLQQILTTLNNQPEHNQTSIWIEFMEDSIYQKEFKDIIPKGYWHRIDSYHQKNKTVSLDFTWTPDLKLDDLMTGWEVNTESDRTSTYIEEAYKHVLKWAEKNITPPFYLEPDQMVQYGIDEEDPMAIHIHFPYFSSKPEEEGEDYENKLKGYVTVKYQVDQKTFSDIKTEKEL